MKLELIYNKTLDEKIYTATHQSGLRVCIMPKPDYVKSYAIIGTDFGSVDNSFISFGENEVTNVPDGIAHFLEHKLFEQPNGTNVFESYARYGASANAYTTFDITAYLFESTENIKENLDILLGFVQNPYFTDENVSKEQGIIGQEINMYDDEPSWRLMMNFLSSMYHEHPVRNDIAGSIESISKITKETLYKCYNTFYDPSNMALFVVGNVDAEDIAACAEKNIKSKAVPAGEIKRFYGNEPKAVRQREVSQSLSVSVPMFMFGFKDTDCGYDGGALLNKIIEVSVLSEIIFGKTGTIHNKLYNEGHILGDLEAEVTCEKDYGFMAVSSDSKDPMKVRDIILSELDVIKKSGVSSEEIQRTKRAFLGNYIKQFNDVSAISHSYMANVFKGISPFDFVDGINSVTEDDIQKRLMSYFNEDASVLSIVNPV